MDNLTHTLCGLALARAGLDRRGALVVPVCAIAANVPDLDLVTTGMGVDYLRYHRGVTHSLAGVVVETLVVALVAFGLGRALRVEKARFGPILAAAFLGLASHLLLDSLNTYGVRPFLPFLETRYHGDMAFIVDPWLWLLFGAGAFLGGERGPRATSLWISVTLLALVVVASEGSLGMAALFLAGVIGVVLVHRREGPRRARCLAALGLVAVYILGLALLSHLSLVRGLTSVEPKLKGAVVEKTSVNPVPGVPWRSTVIVETRDRIWFESVDLLAKGASHEGDLEKHLDDPLLKEAEGTPEYAAWRSFARHPFVARVWGGLLLGDARYNRFPTASWCNLEVRLPR